MEEIRKAAEGARKWVYPFGDFDRAYQLWIEKRGGKGVPQYGDLLPLLEPVGYADREDFDEEISTNSQRNKFYEWKKLREPFKP